MEPRGVRGALVHCTLRCRIFLRNGFHHPPRRHYRLFGCRVQPQNRGNPLGSSAGGSAGFGWF
jgi:hypothetical protein